MNVLNINLNFDVSSLYKNLSEHLKINGCNFKIYYPVLRNRDISKYKDVEYLDIDKCLNKYDRILFFYRSRKLLKNIEKKYDLNEFNLIHAHSLFSNGYIAYKLNKKFGIPYIVAVRNTDVNLFFKKIFYLRKIGINILRNAKKIIFISNSYKNYTIDKYIPNKFRQDINNKSIVLPNGIDDFWFDNEFSNKNIKNMCKEINLLYVGIINKNKNLIATLKACDLLIQDGYSVKYTVIGNNLDNDIFNEVNSKNYVNYLGSMQKEELIKYYRMNDIFIMPSITETFGLSYVEAMSQSLPIIYTKGQGFDGFFDDGVVGYSVDSNNYTEIKDRIIKIMKDYQNISKNCVNCYKEFNWNDISKQYIKLYNEI